MDCQQLHWTKFCQVEYSKTSDGVSKLSFISFFHKHAGYKLYLILVLSFIAGLLESFGLAMTLPLLYQFSDDGKAYNFGQNDVSDFLVSLLSSVGLETSLGLLLIVITVAFVLKAAFLFFSLAIDAKLKADLTKKIKNQLLSDLMLVKWKYFATRGSGFFASIAGEQVNKISVALGNLVKAGSNAIQALVLVLFAFVLAWRYGILICFTGFVIFIIFRHLNSLVRSNSLKFSAESANVASEVVQCFKGFKYFIATNRLDALVSSIKVSISKLRQIQFLLGLTAAFTRSVREPITVIVVVSIIYFQVVILGEDIAPIIVSTLFLYRALNSLMAVQINLQGLYENGGSIEIVESELHNLQSKRNSGAGSIKAAFENEIRFSNVSFSYEENTRALNEVNFSIPKGASVAFVGQSGCGKTTLLDLLTRVIQPEHGKIAVDGVDISGFQIGSWQQLIGYVPQEPIILADTIFENVTFGNQNPGESSQEVKEVEVKELLAKVGLGELLEGLPLGVHTSLGEGGLGLSGGQKQRLAICRELFKKPQLLVLDEATSSLDKNSEAIIFSCLKQLSNDVTVIIVTHSPEMVDWVDHVVHLQGGVISAQGPWANVFHGSGVD